MWSFCRHSYIRVRDAFAILLVASLVNVCASYSKMFLQAVLLKFCVQYGLQNFLRAFCLCYCVFVSCVMCFLSFRMNITVEINSGKSAGDFISRWVFKRHIRPFPMYILTVADLGQGPFYCKPFPRPSLAHLDPLLMVSGSPTSVILRIVILVFFWLI